MKVNYKSQNTKQHYTYLVFSENSDNTIFDLYEKTAFRSLKKVIEHFKQFDKCKQIVPIVKCANLMHFVQFDQFE